MPADRSAPANSASTPAIAALLAADVPHTVHAYEHDPASDLSYGLEAAAALGVDGAQVFKTLCVTTADALAMAIVPVTQSLDLKAVAKAFGVKKAAMADPAQAERVTGYVVGGISPLGGRKQLATVLDTSAFSFDEIFVSGGRRGLDIALSPAALVELTGAISAPVGKES